MNAEHDKFGKPVGGSRWFEGEPKVVETEVKTYEERWFCPIDNCSGEMRYNGFTWSTHPPGHHHTCNKCGFTAALHGGLAYPRTVTR